AYVPQGQTLLPALNVLENVKLPLVLGGWDDTAACTRALEALEQFDLSQLEARLPDDLSAGQMQRVAIVRAVAQRPRLLVADEPTGQLDQATAARAIDALLDFVSSSGAALLLSTHDVSVADRLAERWTMTDGRLDTGDRDTRTRP